MIIWGVLCIGSEDDESGTCSSDDPNCSTTNTKSSFSETKFNWEDEEPKERELELIKYKDSKEGKKSFRLLQEIQKSCKTIGTQLGIGKPSLDGYEKTHDKDPIEMCLQVFYFWSTAGLDDYPYTWGSIVEMLKDVQLNGIAKKLKKALDNKV